MGVWFRRGWACGMLMSLMLAGCTTGPPSPGAENSSAATSPTPATIRITVQPPEKPIPTKPIVDDPATVFSRPESLPIGPRSFYVDGDTITLYDFLNDQFVTYRNGKKIRTVDFEDRGRPQDLLIIGDHYWILTNTTDDNGLEKDTVRHYTIKPGTNRFTLIKEYPAKGKQPTWITREGNNIVLQTIDDKLRRVAGTDPFRPAPKMSLLKNGFGIHDDQTNTEIIIPGEPIGIGLLARTDHYNYYWVVDYTETLRNAGWIYQLTKTGELVHTYTMIQLGIGEPNRSFQIAPNGQVYEMVITNKTTRIYRIAPNT